LAQQGKASLRILVADDDADMVGSFAMLLEQVGHRVETATSAQAALETARRSLPDLIFLDVSMPDMNGWQLAPLLRQHLAQHPFALVAVTGRADVDAHVQSRKAGFDAHVAKPIDMPLLHSILKQMRSKLG